MLERLEETHHVSDVFRDALGVALADAVIDETTVAALGSGYCSPVQFELLPDVVDALNLAYAETVKKMGHASQTDLDFCNVIKNKMKQYEAEPRLDDYSLSQKLLRFYHKYLLADGAVPNEEIVNRLTSGGFCNAFTTLVSQGLLQDNISHEKGDASHERDDWQHIKTEIFQPLSSWDGERELTQKQKTDFEKILSALQGVQFTNSYLSAGQGDIDKISLYTTTKPLDKLYSLAGLPTKTELQSYVDLIFQANRKLDAGENNFLQILISSYDHDVSLVKIDEKVFLVDSINVGMVMEINPKDAGDLLFFLNDYPDSKPGLFSLRVFGFGSPLDIKPADELLSQSEVVKKPVALKPFLPQDEKSVAEKTELDQKIENFYTKYFQKKSPLEAALYIDSETSMRFWLKLGMRPDIRNAEGVSPAGYAIQQHRHDLLKILFNEYHLNVETFSSAKDGYRLIHQAIVDGNIDIIQELIKRGADLFAINKDQCNSVHMAANGGHYEVVKLLLETAPTLAETRGFHNESLLHAAAYSGDPQIIRLLIEKYKMDPMQENADGELPFHVAITQGNLIALRTLLEYKPEMLHEKIAGVSLLHLAVLADNRPIADFLLRKGCHPLEKTLGGETAVGLAANDAMRNLLMTRRASQSTLFSAAGRAPASRTVEEQKAGVVSPRPSKQ